MTDTDRRTEPALTAEEWEHVKSNYPWLPQTDSPADVARRAKEFASVAAQEGKLHRAAALALYQQPFGFTWEDVGLLRAIEVVQLTTKDIPYIVAENPGQSLNSLADRLAALLPPR